MDKYGEGRTFLCGLIDIEIRVNLGFLPIAVNYVEWHPEELFYSSWQYTKTTRSDVLHIIYLT